MLLVTWNNQEENKSNPKPRMHPSCGHRLGTRMYPQTAKSVIVLSREKWKKQYPTDNYLDCAKQDTIEKPFSSTCFHLLTHILVEPK